MPGPPTLFDAPHAGAPLPKDGYIQPTLNHGLRIWWAFFWPTTLFTMLIVFVVNFGVRTLYENSTIPAAVANPILKFDTYVVSYAVAFVVMMNILRKNFHHFRVGLLSNHGDPGAVALPPTAARVARVWWTYSWRSFVYRLILTFLASLPLAPFLAIIGRLLGGGVLAGVLIAMIVSTVIDGAVGLFVIYSNILDEDLGDFRVALLPRAAPGEAIVPGGPAAPPAPPEPPLPPRFV
jgi:hypothetical protein